MMLLNFRNDSENLGRCLVCVLYEGKIIGVAKHIASCCKILFV
jgi:hypothetical protein